MKTGRFENIAMSNTAVIPDFMWIVALFIACSFTVPVHAQLEMSRAATEGREGCYG